MFVKTIISCVLLPIFIVFGDDLSTPVELRCSGIPHHNVSMTAYYPDFNGGEESDYLDARGKKLRTLQNFLDGRCEYVTVAMDEDLHLDYGTKLCIPELNEHFGRKIPLQVRDHGSNSRGFGFTRLDVCVRAEEDSYDKAVNQIVTVYVKDQ